MGFGMLGGMGRGFGRLGTPLGGARGFSVPGLPKWSAAVRAMQAGTKRPRWLALGDSTTYGLSELTTNRWAKSWPTQVGTKAAAAGFNYNNVSSNFGAHSAGIATVLANYNNSMTNTGWDSSSNASRFSLGAEFFRCLASGNVLTITPIDASGSAISFDTIDIYTITSDGAPNAKGVFSYSVDGGAATNFDNNGVDAMSKITISGLSLASHTITLTWVSGSGYVLGWNAYNSAIKSIDIFNGGIVGATAGQYNTAPTANPWSMFNAIQYYQPDLVTILLGENDLLTSVATATMQSNLQALISFILSNVPSADILMLTPIPIGNTASFPVATQDTYNAAILSTINSNSLPYIDLYARWGSYAAKQPLGWYSDTNHPSSGVSVPSPPGGYTDIANAVANKIFGI